jgi:hypothetical protein
MEESFWSSASNRTAKLGERRGPGFGSGPRRSAQPRSTRTGRRPSRGSRDAALFNEATPPRAWLHAVCLACRTYAVAYARLCACPVPGLRRTAPGVWPRKTLPAMRAENPGNAGARSVLLSGAERERERERCVSDADASSYGPSLGAIDPRHACPQRTHAKTTPSHTEKPLSQSCDPPQNALQTSTREIKPELTYRARQPPSGYHDQTKITTR